MTTILYDPSRPLHVSFDFNAMTATMNAPLFDQFLRKCEAEGITLNDGQRRFAESLLTNDATRHFMFGGLGSGRTFVTAAVERFCDELKADT